MPVQRPLFAFAVVALSTWTASCHRPNSVLLVEVAGDLNLTPFALSVTVTAPRTAERTFYISPPSGVVSLPASFTVELPGTIVGPVTVAITAIDPLGLIVASGTATRQDLDVGGQTILVVTLVDTGYVVSTPDAGQGGVDAHPTTDAHPTSDAHAAGDARADGPRDAARLDGARDGGADGRPRDAGGGQ
ncbi:MAG TPA: hypothetical protein VMT03_07665 [Polyangia bacterium]|nr:hypothetical protein [Polyangia bacterium]